MPSRCCSLPLCRAVRTVRRCLVTHASLCKTAPLVQGCHGKPTLLRTRRRSLAQTTCSLHSAMTRATGLLLRRVSLWHRAAPQICFPTPCLLTLGQSPSVLIRRCKFPQIGGCATCQEGCHLLLAFFERPPLTHFSASRAFPPPSGSALIPHGSRQTRVCLRSRLTGRTAPWARSMASIKEL